MTTTTTSCAMCVLTINNTDGAMRGCLEHPWGPPPSLEQAVQAAERYHSEMQQELGKLSEAVEAGEANYYQYDERAADLRELAEDHLSAVLAAYRREHPHPAYVAAEGAPF